MVWVDDRTNMMSKAGVKSKKPTETAMHRCGVVMRGKQRFLLSEGGYKDSVKGKRVLTDASELWKMVTNTTKIVKIESDNSIWLDRSVVLCS